MKKSFDQNVPKLKPRLKWQPAAAAAQEETPVPTEAKPPSTPEHEALASLAAAVKSKAAQREEAPLTAAQALRKAIGDDHPHPSATGATEVPSALKAPAPEVALAPSPAFSMPPLEAQAPWLNTSPPPLATPASPAASTTPEPNPMAPEQALAERRARLKERLKAARENPGFLPLPPTAFQAGELAVGRIAQLQLEISKLREDNLQLTQNLEAAQRRAEEAVETARMRMEEMEQVSSDMKERLKLMRELEEEMLAIETERDETLMLLQETRAELGALKKRCAQQEDELQKHEEALRTSLDEEEALAGELETLRMQAEQLAVAHQLLAQDRTSLASQVEELKQERTELLEARKALEAVHKALSKAVVGKASV